MTLESNSRMELAVVAKKIIQFWLLLKMMQKNKPKINAHKRDENLLELYGSAR